MKVFVTGAGSHLAQAVLPALCAHRGIDIVCGVDARPVRFVHPKFEAVRLDLRDAAVTTMLGGNHALVHMGFVHGRNSSANELFDVNVRAAHKLFHAARTAGVKRLIHVSSAAVYGAAVHANEQAPLKPHANFVYAEHAAHLEQLLAIELPECVRLRPHVTLGPHAHPLLKRLVKQPFFLRLPDPQPLFQCVHEDDVAHAVLLCLDNTARGAYNLAIEESFSLRDAIRARHRMSFGAPPIAARSAITVATRLSGWQNERGWMEALSQTLLINCRRAIIELGWRSRHTAHEVLASL